MSMGLLTSALLAAAGPPPAAMLVEADEILLTPREVRLGDLVRAPGGAALDADLAGRVVAVVPRGQQSLTLPRAALAGLLRRAAPGLRLAGPDRPGAILLRLAPAPGARDGRGCLALVAAVPRGAPIAAGEAETVACDPARRAAPLAFDARAGLVRAAGDLPAGAYLGRLALGPRPAVVRGARLTLVAAVGPVRIEREVIALQDGRSDRRLFVRDGDGQVFAARLAAAARR